MTQLQLSYDPIYQVYFLLGLRRCIQLRHQSGDGCPQVRFENSVGVGHAKLLRGDPLNFAQLVRQLQISFGGRAKQLCVQLFQHVVFYGGEDFV